MGNQEGIVSLLVRLLPEATGFPWYGTAPKGQAPPFGTVERTGGGMAGPVDKPMVALQIWAATPAKAERFAGITARAVCSLPAISPVRAASINSSYEYTATKGGLARWQITADLVTVAR